MQLRNTTDWDSKFLRRMVSWVCRQVGYPVKRLKAAEFGKRSSGAYNGRAFLWRRSIRVVIGPARCYPVKPHLYPGTKNAAFMSPEMRDQIEGLVGVTAHEIEHLFSDAFRKHRKVNVNSERFTQAEERRVVELFRANRVELMAKWETPAKTAEPKPEPTAALSALQQKRADRAQALLDEWKRKEIAVKKKVQQYKRKVAYYSKAAAAKRSGE